MTPGRSGLYHFSKVWYNACVVDMISGRRTSFMRYSKGYSSASPSSRLKPLFWIVLILVAAVVIFKLAGVGGISQGNFEIQRNREPLPA